METITVNGRPVAKVVEEYMKVFHVVHVDECDIDLLFITEEHKFIVKDKDGVTSYPDYNSMRKGIIRRYYDIKRFERIK